MGNPTDPPTPGDDCLECFTAGETPLIVAVTFGGIVTCNGAIGDVNKTFLLEQDPGTPCLWEYGEGDIQVQWYTDIFGNSLLTFFDGADKIFEKSIAETCITEFTNALNCADPNVIAHLGTATVDSDLPSGSYVVKQVMESINMEREPNTKYEIYDVDVDQDVVLLARKQNGTRISILIDEDAF